MHNFSKKSTMRRCESESESECESECECEWKREETRERAYESDNNAGSCCQSPEDPVNAAEDAACRLFRHQRL